MPATTLLVPAPRLASSAALSAGALALYGEAMAPRLTAMLRFGAICSGHGSLALHCPACYAAAAMAAGAAGLALSAAWTAKRSVAARPVRPAASRGPGR